MTVTADDYIARRPMPEPLRSQLETTRRRLARSNDAGLGEDALRLRAWQEVVGHAPSA